MAGLFVFNGRQNVLNCTPFVAGGEACVEAKRRLRQLLHKQDRY